MRVAFVYPNPRAELAREVARGEAPDTGLLGQNHLAALGIDAFVHDSRVRKRHVTGGLVHRLSWITREVTLPWELRGADVIVTPLQNLLPIVARLRRGPRVLIVSYGTIALWERASAARRALLRASLGAAGAIVTISRAGKEGLVDRIGVDEQRVTIAPFGVDASFWRPSPAAAGGHILSVGRDLARDYATFCQAMAGIPARGVIVAKRENLLGVTVPENVELRTSIPLDELRELYAGSSCVVVPMVEDGDPRGTESSGNTALLEAMACGRATVVTERASLREYVYDDASLTAPGGDADALRARIEQLRLDPARSAAMGEAARRRIEQEHTSEQFARRLAVVLQALGEN